MRSSSPIRAVVFDMDGLLIDSEQVATNCWIEAANHFNLAFPHILLDAMVGMHTSHIPAFLCSQLGEAYPVYDIAARCHELYLAAITLGVPLKAGVYELLDFLEKNGLPKAVATSSQRTHAEHHLRHADILHRFQFIVTSEEVKHPKPAPDIYLLATQKLGVSPAEAIALEDSAYGIQAALAAGLRGIMVPDKQQPSDQIKALGHPIVNNLAAAQQLIAVMLS